MAIEFDEGYAKQPYSDLVADYPGEEAYSAQDFRVEWGPIFHRGRLDGTARILVLGQDPAQHETIVRRILVGTAGKRAQGFLRRLGLTRSYVFINTFLYSVYGQGGGNRHIDDVPITTYRNLWIQAILDNNPIEAVVAFGMLAERAWQAWLTSPAATRRPVLPFQHLKHPTWPESSTHTAAERKTAIRVLLENWNDGLQALRPAMQHPDVSGPLELYGMDFTAEDLPDIAARDLPAGIPDWMRTEEGWATREGDSPLKKRRTVVVTVPKTVLPN